MFTTAPVLATLALALLSAATPDTSRIYGRVTTVDGEQFEGFIRWDRNETSWADILHASKRMPEAYVRAGEELLGDRPRRRGPDIEIFGVRLTFGDGDEFAYPRTASTGIRFAHILTLEPVDRNDARLVLISGQEVELRSGGDVGRSVREIVVDDPLVGVTSLEWDEIERVEFFSAPADVEPRAGDRLFGTLDTRQGARFTGFIAWDVDEVLDSDVLDGDERGRDREIRFGDIARIERVDDDAARVRLRSGRELVLDGSNDVDDSNRGILVSEPSFGQVRVEWEQFRRLEFQPVPPDLAVLDPAAAERRIEGTVHTTDGRTVSGAIRWDNDEEFAWEFLNGELDGIEFEIEFSALRSIERVGDASRVTLHDGRTWLLSGSNDVDEDNKGIFVTLPDGDTVAIAWEQVRRVDFSAAPRA